MIRAISYTVIFCGMSAGAALALAFVHNAQTNGSAPHAARIAPQAFSQPSVSGETTAVRFAPATRSDQPTARVAPILQAAPSAAPAQPVVTPNATPAPKTQKAALQKRSATPSARQVIGMSTQSSGAFMPSLFGTDIEGSGIAATAPSFAPADVDISRNLRENWITGVYR